MIYLQSWSKYCVTVSHILLINAASEENCFVL